MQIKLPHHPQNWSRHGLGGETIRCFAESAKPPSRVEIQLQPKAWKMCRNLSIVACHPRTRLQCPPCLRWQPRTHAAASDISIDLSAERPGVRLCTSCNSATSAADLVASFVARLIQATTTPATGTTRRREPSSARCGSRCRVFSLNYSDPTKS